MDDALDYETPGVGEKRGVLFVEGNVLVVRDGTSLPRVCIVCGGEGTERGIKLTFTWDGSFQVTKQRPSLEMRRTGSVVAHFCQRHHRQWAGARVVGGGGLVASGVMMAAGTALAVISESSDVPRWAGAGIGLLLAGFGMMILFLFVFALRTRTMSCQRIEAGYLYLDGAGEGFVRSLEFRL